MNCEDMTRIPQLNNVLNMKAGAAGMKNTIRWIYFADCLQCVKNEYHVEDYIHGGEFVVLTNPDVTEDKNKLMVLITSMVDYGIAALGINEGQILPELIEYCNKERLPLFELPEKFPLVDLSQILCKRLVLEENNRNLEEQVFASILDAEHLNRVSSLTSFVPSLTVKVTFSTPSACIAVLSAVIRKMPSSVPPFSVSSELPEQDDSIAKQRIITIGRIVEYIFFISLNHYRDSLCYH